MIENKLGGKMSGVAILLGVALLGLLLIFIGNNGETDVKSDDGSAAREEIPCAQEYARSVEEKIIKLCSGVYGVKNISVVVSISGGYDAVYAQNSQSNSAGYKNEFVLVGEGTACGVFSAEDNGNRHSLHGRRHELCEKRDNFSCFCYL